jgi:hypothetical protein
MQLKLYQLEQADKYSSKLLQLIKIIIKIKFYKLNSCLCVVYNIYTHIYPLFYKILMIFQNFSINLHSKGINVFL